VQHLKTVSEAIFICCPGKGLEGPDQPGQLHGPKSTLRPIAFIQEKNRSPGPGQLQRSWCTAPKNSIGRSCPSHQIEGLEELEELEENQFSDSLILFQSNTP